MISACRNKAVIQRNSFFLFLSSLELCSYSKVKRESKSSTVFHITFKLFRSRQMVSSIYLSRFPIFFFAAHAVQLGTGQKRPEIDGHRKQGRQGIEQSYLFMIFLILFGWTLFLLDEI
jgi:hypothetical protein